jgi:hypothetical protein
MGRKIFNIYDYVIVEMAQDGKTIMDVLSSPVEYVVAQSLRGRIDSELRGTSAQIKQACHLPPKFRRMFEGEWPEW